ncbi:hypothetical protein CBP31_00005 [Oceanisphaera profunda]|uniref:Uncharacterized protein n=1 Tax=Oceanisphaera profunda TaxID=1416627 RepID=A0A1Y0D8I6_9GAMM|nr:hypothetical protein [Oceanisphaera profunda]ART83859.1 hypothetical protein CBP31_00005 [Oceanisphaera profunda]
MMDKKQEYLEYLQASFRDYFADFEQSAIERVKAKSFINGLMVAGKIFGVTSEELQQALSREQSHRVSDSTKRALEGQDLIEIPAYIRFPKQPS